ncbi:DUF6058 family natural product biosynthesis protein (plasmid) [Pseudoalteromonas xiamenensis]|uniref:DUF6058 family natural product biosynthesis protein n=1 Tax=Pseudoalteromonas xiamenensis TaxID=882626 RepID=UPI0027E52A88|nr:DUF6058 family natural product biosynthesis protein [Pseudoalteromonas xiamenensis]WMN61775.1 DUF6058 family natural product biosynthesis protein [Pseudoalteromonas xiamenensis]
MELMEYLSTHFLNKTQLLSAAQVSDEELRNYQESGLVPTCSYKLNLNLDCHSFFGEHLAHGTIEYFAKGYVEWLQHVHAASDKNAVYRDFAIRYRHTLENLKKLGFECAHPNVNELLDSHIDKEWQHFLNGTYGLCTQSGLPEDIAAKELAILIINALTLEPMASDLDKEKLMQAVDLLDSVSAQFAPHERERSSRHRLIDEVRRKYLV